MGMRRNAPGSQFVSNPSPVAGFMASLGLPVGSGATPCPILGDAADDNGVFVYPKATMWLVCGLLVSLGGSRDLLALGCATSPVIYVPIWGHFSFLHQDFGHTALSPFHFSGRKRFAGAWRAKPAFFMSCRR